VSTAPPTGKLPSPGVRPDLGASRSTPYARPVIKEPVWSWEVPVYLYTGGLGGASATLAFGAEVAGNERFARRAWGVALAGVGLSPLLLMSDLGRPLRFLNMLRVFKVTSPMSVGSWLLAAAGPTIGVAALGSWTGRLGPAARICRPLAGLIGMPLSTYTAALLANTAVPAWHEVRHEMPFVFAASALASAGAGATIAAPHGDSGPARALAAAGAGAEVALVQFMEHRAGDLGDAYKSGGAGTLGTIGKVLSGTGAALIATRGRRSVAAARAGAALVSAGALAMRWSVFKAGSQSAANPVHTVAPQRARIERGETHGSVRRAA
jgi:Polysulphide reductase, NrfD